MPANVHHLHHHLLYLSFGGFKSKTEALPLLTFALIYTDELVGDLANLAYLPFKHEPFCLTLRQSSNRHLRPSGPLVLMPFEINTQLFQFLHSLLRSPFLPAAWWGILSKHSDFTFAAYPIETPSLQQFSFAKAYGWSLNGDLDWR